MQREGIEPTEKGMTESLEALGVAIKASLARRLWGEAAFYRVANTHDDRFFAEALGLLLTPTQYNAILGIEN